MDRGFTTAERRGLLTYATYRETGCTGFIFIWERNVRLKALGSSIMLAVPYCGVNCTDLRIVRGSVCLRVGNHWIVVQTFQKAVKKAFLRVTRLLKIRNCAIQYSGRVLKYPLLSSVRWYRHGIQFAGNSISGTYVVWQATLIC